MPTRRGDRFRSVQSALENINIDDVYSSSVEIANAQIDPEDGQEVRRALSTAARAAYRAHQLFLLARREVQLVEYTEHQVQQRWRKDSRKFWDGEKVAKRTTKAITDIMITDYVVEKYPKKYGDSLQRIRDAKQVRDELEALSRALSERLHNLRVFARGGITGEGSYRDASREAH